MSTSISNLGFGVSGGVSLLHRNKPVWLGIYIIFTFLDSFGFCLFIYLFSNLIFPLPLSFKYRRDECLGTRRMIFHMIKYVPDGKGCIARNIVFQRPSLSLKI